MAGRLSPEQIERYHRDGFVVVPDVAAPADCAALRGAAESIVEQFQPSTERTVFTTHQQERVSNREFLASGGGIWCFFEAGAFDESGVLRQPKQLSINKIGHAMHDLDPVFERFTYTAQLAAIAADVGLTDALVLQSMYIFKQPHIGGEVGCHQDATFLCTEPSSVVGFWFAIEDATVDNGCMWALPGGHRTPLRSRFRRIGGDDDGTEFELLDDTAMPPTSGLVPLEVTAGTLIVLHGLLPHWSDVNRSSTSRHAYSVHCIDASAVYPDWNWIRRPADLPLRSLQHHVLGPEVAPA
jgi:phytanoyl-CoA hydroxylase